MEIDFHFSVTYIVGRVAGLNHEEAETVATSSQYVDDTVNSGVLQFKTGESFNRISSAHEFTDYHLYIPTSERMTWIPFHFLPGNSSAGPHQTEFFNRIVCRPNSQVAKDMLDDCISKKGRPFGLHLLGITSHVFIDTWAHQGFAGVRHRINKVMDIDLQDGSHLQNIFSDILAMCKKLRVWGLLQRFSNLIASELLNMTFPMGHGAALHYPDHPFRVWEYKNGFGERVLRDNPKDFLEAADELCRFIQRYVRAGANTVYRDWGLPSEDREKIALLIREIKDDSGVVRNEKWLHHIRHGYFSFGPGEPKYIKEGIESWKHQAYGGVSGKVYCWQKFDYSPDFESSNWKNFHEALQDHQYTITREILPRYGICAI